MSSKKTDFVGVERACLRTVMHSIDREGGILLQESSAKIAQLLPETNCHKYSSWPP